MAEAQLICRIQDAEGRGPYRPGFSHWWSEREVGPDPFFVAFPDVLARCRGLIREKGGAVGCGFRNMEQAHAWFSTNEVLTLASLGFVLCWINADEILAENTEQLVFWSAKTLASAVIHKGWKQPDGVQYG